VKPGTASSRCGISFTDLACPERAPARRRVVERHHLLVIRSRVGHLHPMLQRRIANSDSSIGIVRRRLNAFAACEVKDAVRVMIASGSNQNMGVRRTLHTEVCSHQPKGNDRPLALETRQHPIENDYLMNSSGRFLRCRFETHPSFVFPSR
jgi:hypothetical protein